MKIVSFTPGLGNQIFQYAMVLYLRKMFPGETVYAYFKRCHRKKHNGLEINRVFDVDFPPTSFFSNLVAITVKTISKLHHACPWYCSDKKRGRNTTLYPSTIFLDGYWIDKKYISPDVLDLPFKLGLLSDNNRAILQQITSANSVSLHVRRGDYILPKKLKLYGGICTPAYYEQAIARIRSEIPTPQFFVFSDDPEWVKNNLKIDHAVYVSGNSGKDSYLDMYLISQCRAHIIANSTFSYWGARLCKNSLVVVCPPRLDNVTKHDIYPDDWEVIE